MGNCNQTSWLPHFGGHYPQPISYRGYLAGHSESRCERHLFAEATKFARTQLAEGLVDWREIKENGDDIGEQTKRDSTIKRKICVVGFSGPNKTFKSL